jgi:hypothetical protein
VLATFTGACVVVGEGVGVGEEVATVGESVAVAVIESNCGEEGVEITAGVAIGFGTLIGFFAVGEVDDVFVDVRTPLPQISRLPTFTQVSRRPLMV